jgi:hypothetical protein
VEDGNPSTVPPRAALSSSGQGPAPA